VLPLKKSLILELERKEGGKVKRWALLRSNIAKKKTVEKLIANLKREGGELREGRPGLAGGTAADS